MDETRSEVAFWVALFGGLFFTYNSSAALLTNVARAGRGRLLQGEDAVVYGWIVLMIGVTMLLFALMRFIAIRQR
ncbi:MAG: hypothetical protein H7145_09235 [Akkermansiaceae bacterium]|nr:hypothetical protein [Armatimonadota bacterium]